MTQERTSKKLPGTLLESLTNSTPQGRRFRVADRRQLVYTYRACYICNDEIKTVTDEVASPVIMCFDCNVMFRMQFGCEPTDDQVWEFGSKYGVYGIMEEVIPMYQSKADMPAWAQNLDVLREEYWNARA